MALNITAAEARDATQALVTHHQLQVEEWDTTVLPKEQRASYMGHLFRLTDGRNILVVPVGQDPVERLVAVNKLVDYVGRS
ncbi:hypothetical protein [Streptomyces wuyuanensis]|uniref:hypothetical protein n=1 Tax=Streptomyces wuyuanensis TaxID=1196353 RepID=UPI0034234BC2